MLSSWKKACAGLMFCAGLTVMAPAQTFTTLFRFDGANGANPQLESLVQGIDGNLYGTTTAGGTGKCGGCGTIFKITPAGALTSLYSFCPGGDPCAHGADPYSGLVQGTDGQFYGTTSQGGVDDDEGTVFKITSGGKLTTIHKFCSQTDCADGSSPRSPLVEAVDGNFYGTTVYNGSSNGGTAFKLTPEGTLTALYSFCAKRNCTDGDGPVAGLLQATDGNLYGTTIAGGNTVACDNGVGSGCGTVFKIATGGKLSTLYRFCSQPNCADGSTPWAGLAQGTDGNLYGTTEQGGNTNCTYGCGTIFRITPERTLTTLYSFCAQPGCPDGAAPFASLVQGTDGNFYGTTARGGGSSNCTGGCGTIFQITPGGTLTTLYSFCAETGCPDGEGSQGGLIQATDGAFYGTTYLGGDDDNGTVFSLSMGLGPFVKALPAAGKVGAEVGILGTDLTGATGVTFNGASAEFNINSPSLILAYVPAGATTGTVQVTLLGQTLSSNVPFYVLK